MSIIINLPNLQPEVALFLGLAGIIAWFLTRLHS